MVTFVELQVQCMKKNHEKSSNVFRFVVLD